MSSSFVIQTPCLQKESLLEDDDDSRLTDSLKEQVSSSSSSSPSKSTTSPKRRSRRILVQATAQAPQGPPPSLVATLEDAIQAGVGYDSLYQLLQFLKGTLVAKFEGCQIQFVQNDSNDSDNSNSATISVRHVGVGSLVRVQVQTREDSAAAYDPAENPIVVQTVQGQQGEPRQPPIGSSAATPRGKLPGKPPKITVVEDEEEEESKQQHPDDVAVAAVVASEARRRSLEARKQEWDEKWNAMLEKLKQFRKEKGHANVQKGYISDRHLGNWVASQRTARKEGKLKQERIEALDDLGFVWSFRTIGQAQDMKDSANLVNWDEPAAERKWKAMLERLKEYNKEYGNCRVPSGYKNDPQLAYWVQNQRVLYRKEKLPQDRIKALEEIDFLWRVFPSSPGGPRLPSTMSRKAQAEQDAKWNDYMDRLKAFKEEHTHAVVPQRYEKDLDLGKWVQNQRRMYHQDKMREDRKEQLEAIGFVWKVGTMGDRTWQYNFDRLLAFKEKWGDCLVPTKYEPDQRLASWVMWQRGKYHQNKLPDEYIAKLDAVGFVWKVQRKGRRINHTSDVRGGYKNSETFVIWSPSTSNEFWQAQLEKLKAYKAKFGHTNVPVVYFEDLQLAKWVTAQRMMYTKGTLTQERINQLEEIGFVWRLVRTWEDNYERLRQFHEKHGHCNVAIDDPEDPKLGRWVRTQRAFSKRKDLTAERFQKLQALGFEWNIPKTTKPAGGMPTNDAAAATTTICSPGAAVGAATTANNFPPTFKKSPPLDPETRTARLKAHNARLSQDRKDLVAENRDLRRKLKEAEEANSWEDSFAQLQDYIVEHGDAHVPTAGTKLGAWVAKMRDHYKKGSLSQERIAKLTSVGFAFALQRGGPPNRGRRRAGECSPGQSLAPVVAVEAGPPTKKFKTATDEILLEEEQKLKMEESKLAEAKRKLEEEKQKLRLRREALQAAQARKRQ